MPGPYEVVFTRSARRGLERDLPEKVATAALEFIMGPLRQDPRKVGKPLREPLAPLFAARRGGNDTLIWPHRDGLIWPRLRHAGLVVTV